MIKEEYIGEDLTKVIYLFKENIHKYVTRFF
ncbi:hypothetical protein BACCIP111895_03512 [Neobacillus rhizosphaerae]|uniref:Uncharacterized protein n=1 Tax=Neobacillus rhizosphaerae TaxID=2880965 RepID=A0ABM9EVT0_9BACI|nr:hypothetical protein BACCIP111895_03512 [Neobacillus rhizosphaerae]